MMLFFLRFFCVLFLNKREHVMFLFVLLRFVIVVFSGLLHQKDFTYVLCFVVFKL